MILKFKIASTRDEDENTRDEKIRLQKEFWDRQIEFGMYETIEASEATAQLLLQLWFLGANYDLYYEDGFLIALKKAINGAIFMFVPGTTIEEKSLGKFLISFCSITVSAVSMYRRTKRDSVQITSSMLLVISIVSQIVVHIACIMPLYFVERDWKSLVLPILIHYCLIAILKTTLDPGFLNAIGSKKTIWILNIVGSSIINVNLIPPKGYATATTANEMALRGQEKNKRQTEEHSPLNGNSTTQRKSTHHNQSTFFLQTTYFVIRFAENLTVLLLVTQYCEMQNNPLFRTFPYKLGLTLGFGSVISWLSHMAYYRLYGHPWKSSNGPTANISKEANKNFLKCDLFLCGSRKSIKFINFDKLSLKGRGTEVGGMEATK